MAYPDSCITGDVRLEKLGEELAPDSSVWSTYMAAAGADDKGMVDDYLCVLHAFLYLYGAVCSTGIEKGGLAKDLRSILPARYALHKGFRRGLIYMVHQPILWF